MNHFERVAIFTLVENIENQLKGLKTLIAASANIAAPSGGSHKVTQTIDHESHELSDDDEDRLQAELEKARTVEIERMRKSAETHFQNEWDQGVKAMSDLDG